MINDERYLNNPVRDTIFIDSLSKLTPALLTSTIGPDDVQAVAFRPSEVHLDDVPALVALTQVYHLSLGFTKRQKSRSTVFLPEPVEGLVAAYFDDRTALVDMVLDTVEKHFASIWRSTLGNAAVNAPKAMLQRSVALEDSLRVDDGGQAVGLVTLAPSHDCLECAVNQVSWIWIDSSLPVYRRRLVGNTMIRWLDAKGGFQQAAIHPVNIASQKFFLRAGFRLTCVHARKK